MLNTIAVMNTKGGVGKSTLVLALAETMSAFHGKNVLVIDSDAQASVSSMLMSVNSLYTLQQEGRTIVDYLVATVLNNAPTDWTRFIVPKVSDVDDARGVYLLPSDMQLTLLEREVSKESRHTRLRSAIGRLLADAGNVFDVVLVDCPPGLSVLTECWLREAAFHISPTKPDYVSICGLEVFRRFKALNPEMGFARNLGVIVNLEDSTSATDTEYTAWLGSNSENRCFTQAVPRVKALQDAARHQALDRSFAAKYPGAVGAAIRSLTAELLERLQLDQTAAALTAAVEEQRRASEPTPAAASPALETTATQGVHPAQARASQSETSQVRTPEERSGPAPAPSADASPAPAQPASAGGSLEAAAPFAGRLSSGSATGEGSGAGNDALSATMAAAAMAPVTMAMSVAAAAMAPLTTPSASGAAAAEPPPLPARVGPPTGSRPVAPPPLPPMAPPSPAASNPSAQAASSEPEAQASKPSAA